MPAPFLRSRSPLVGSYTHELSIPMGAAEVGDLIVVYNFNSDWGGSGSGVASPPPGFETLISADNSGGSFEQIFYAKIKGSNFSNPIVMQVDDDAAIGSWYGYVDVIGGVSWRAPGWVELDGAVGNYVTKTKTTLPSATGQQFAARVRLDQLGVAQWFEGWATGDAGFGLDASNRPLMFVKNTLGNSIGNISANADIPGLEVGKLVWLMGSVDAATAQCSYWYSFDDVENFFSVHWAELGTPVIGTNAGTTMRVTNSGGVFIGTRDALTAPMDGRIYAAAQLRPGVNYEVIETFSEPLDVTMALVGSADHVRPTSDDGNNSPIEDWGLGSSFIFLSDFFAPSRNIYGPNRMVYNAWLGGNFGPEIGGTGGHFENPVSGPAGWDVYSDRAIQTNALYTKIVTRTNIFQTDPFVHAVTGNAPAISDGHYSFGVLSLAIRGRVDAIALPADPQPERLRLGCAETYTTWLTDATYERTIEKVRWSRIEWERVLDDISVASATFPDALGGVACVANLGGLEPWAYGLRIERNDAEVWSGAIHNVSRRGGEIIVGASDVFARYQKRFLTRNPADFIETDAAVAFREAITVYAKLPSDQWELRVPDITVGVPLTRKLLPYEFKYSWDFLAEVFDACLDGYIMNGVLYLWQPNEGWRYQAEITRTLDGPYNTNHEFVYGTFTEEAFSRRPDWSIDGAGQTNYSVVPSAESGEFGFRSFEKAENLDSQIRYGVLDSVDPEPLDLPEDASPSEIVEVLRARAESVSALRSIPPIVVEGGVLSQEAPIDVHNLRPGSLWKMDVYDHGYGQLLTVGRLRRVKVSVSMTDDGLSETISPTLYPPGWTGEM